MEIVFIGTREKKTGVELLSRDGTRSRSYRDSTPSLSAAFFSAWELLARVHEQEIMVPRLSRLRFAFLPLDRALEMRSRSALDGYQEEFTRMNADWICVGRPVGEPAK